MAENGNILSTTTVSGGSSLGEGQDRSAVGLQAQRFSLGVNATGAALGVGRRVAVEPDVLFSHPISGAQFGGQARNARSTAREFEESQNEEE